MRRGMPQLGSMRHYVVFLNKEIGAAEKLMQDINDEDYSKVDAKHEIQVAIATLQIAAYSNEFDPGKMTDNEVKELGQVMFEGKETDNLKLKRMKRPHKQIQKFLDKHQEKIEYYEVL